MRSTHLTSPTVSIIEQSQQARCVFKTGLRRFHPEGETVLWWYSSLLCTNECLITPARWPAHMYRTYVTMWAVVFALQIPICSRSCVLTWRCSHLVLRLENSGTKNLITKKNECTGICEGKQLTCLQTFPHQFLYRGYGNKAPFSFECDTAGQVQLHNATVVLFSDLSHLLLFGAGNMFVL